MMDFPIADLMDERACYDRLVALLHPGGLACHRSKDHRLGSCAAFRWFR